MKFSKKFALTMCMLFISVLTYALPMKETKLKTLNWAPNTYKALNTMIEKNSINNPNYDIRNKPYAVFDFDNTTAMNDIQEAMLIYQLENLRFKASPEQLKEALKTEVPKGNFSDEFKNSKGESLNIDIVAEDCVTSYTWLYNNYKGLGGNGTKSLAEVKKAPEYRDFITKVRYLYDAIGGTFSADISYPWVTYLFSGMTSEEVQALAEDSADYWLKRNDYKKVTWTSPKERPGKAGIVNVTYKTGLRVMPEMVDLYNTLMENGIEVYVCSASFIDVIKVAATNPKYGLNVKPSNVFAMQLKTDKDGKIINQYDYNNYFQTQGAGKSKTINKFIRPNHGGKGPILVAGDSDGDYNMLVDYKDMEVGLIINRVKGGPIGELSKKAVDTLGKNNAVYYLQGRNENTGLFIPTEKTIVLGSKDEKLVK